MQSAHVDLHVDKGCFPIYFGVMMLASGLCWLVLACVTTGALSVTRSRWLRRLSWHGGRLAKQPRQGLRVVKKPRAMPHSTDVGRSRPRRELALAACSMWLGVALGVLGVPCRCRCHAEGRPQCLGHRQSISPLSVGNLGTKAVSALASYALLGSFGQHDRINPSESEREIDNDRPSRLGERCQVKGPWLWFDVRNRNRWTRAQVNARVLEPLGSPCAVRETQQGSRGLWSMLIGPE